ncbi:MAG: hypothetical protein O7J95_03385 [Planctomycetota bacterium]|nr:hypothetical protein [Planctomycetota bacterium]
MRRLLGAFVCLSLAPGPAIGQGRPIPLRIQATFLHEQSPVPYSGILDGVTGVDVVEGANGLELRVPFAPGEPISSLAVWWAPEDANSLSPTSPVSARLTRRDVGEDELNVWLRCGGELDPTFTVRLTPSPLEPDRFTNPAPVKGQLFVRCGDLYRRYGDLTVPASAFDVKVTREGNALQLEFSAVDVALENVSEAAWAQVLQECGNSEVGLPPSPVPGVSSWSGRRPDLASPGTPLVSRLSREIALDLQSLVARGFLGRDGGRLLGRELARVGSAVNAGRPRVAVENADRLAARIAGLESDGVLEPDQAAALQAAAGELRATVQESVGGLVPGPLSAVFCLPPPDCENVRLHVDASTLLPRGKRDGRVTTPFRTIVEALEAATERGLCGVEVRVAFGVYRDDLFINRNTTLSASGDRPPILTGSVVQRGAHALALEGLYFLGSGTGGAVNVENPCAVTTLRNVTIVFARRFGVVQSGGTLRIESSRIRGTRAGRGLMSHGTAVLLRNGVQAVLSGVELVGNQSGALVVEGRGTRVYARLLHVAHSGINPFFRAGLATRNPATRLPDGIAAVEARGGALLLVEWSRLGESEHLGLLARDGARVHFRLGEITGTRCLDHPEGRRGGTNVLVASGASLELTRFISSDAALAGLLLSDGLAKGTAGEFARNEIGIAVLSTLSDFDCLVDGVRMRDNARNIDASMLPLLDTSLPGEGRPPPRNCADVPFDCDWCRDS